MGEKRKEKKALPKAKCSTTADMHRTNKKRMWHAFSDTTKIYFLSLEGAARNTWAPPTHQQIHHTR
jgi:hypothetical protein